MSLRDMLLLATIATYFSKLVAAMDMPMAMGPSAMPMAPSPAFTEPCLLDPKTASCANFELAGDLIEANIVKLCTAMPYMIGCTLNDQCQVHNEKPWLKNLHTQDALLSQTPVTQHPKHITIDLYDSSVVGSIKRLN